MFLYNNDQSEKEVNHSIYNCIKDTGVVTSPLVQWLGMCLPMRVTWVSSQVCPHAIGQLSPCAAITEAHPPYSPCSTREVTKLRTHVLQRRVAPRATTRESPHATMKSPWVTTKTQCSQKLTNFKNRGINFTKEVKDLHTENYNIKT